VNSLKTAAMLEHTLLNSYLTAAMSLKTLPAEFEYLSEINNPSERILNVRKAIQFEYARQWKTSMIEVSREEMLHLHHVSSLFRALGENPHFSLPKKGGPNGGWIIDGWKPDLNDGHDFPNFIVPITTASLEVVKKFILFESTDDLQMQEFDCQLEYKFELIRQWELKLHVAQILDNIHTLPKFVNKNCTDTYACLTKQYREAFTKLYNVYDSLPPREGAQHKPSFDFETASPSSSQDISSNDIDDTCCDDEPMVVDVNGGLKGHSHKLCGTNDTFQEALLQATVKSEEHSPFHRRGPSSFQSIGDFYNQVIKPLYHEAFTFGWVKYNNQDLNNEIQQSNPSEGLVEDMLIYHPFDFAKTKGNFQKPMKKYKQFSSIIDEIVSEGEGFQDFPKKLEALLDVDPILKCNDIVAKTDFAKPLVQLRYSHLYKFITIYTFLKHEIELCKESGLEFEISRTVADDSPNPQYANHPRISSKSQHALIHFVIDIPYYFNALNLVVNVWLARMYEVQTWLPDTARRMTIEMLATWPLMSQGVRPMLELATIFGNTDSHNRRHNHNHTATIVQQLFKWDDQFIFNSPPHVQQLWSLYHEKLNQSKEDAQDFGEAVNKRMDYLALKTLTDIADWAQEQLEIIRSIHLKELHGSDLLPPAMYEIVINRLKILTVLREFEPQFKFRVQGGYSDSFPHPPSSAPTAVPYKDLLKGDEYDEDPTLPSLPQGTPLFDNIFLLRLRFSGYGRVQFATDPEPSMDEVGASGNLWIRATDNCTFDRSNIWQKNPLKNGPTILRPPLHEYGKRMPSVGVHLVDINLMSAVNSVVTKFSDVSTDPDQFNFGISGLNSLLHLKPSEVTGSKDKKIKVELMPDEERQRTPYLVGENHLVWRGGEPIDPFLLKIYLEKDGTNPSNSTGPDLFRPVNNGGKTFMEFTPIQRAKSARALMGLGGGVPPSWSHSEFSTLLQELYATYGGNYIDYYYKDRVQLLGEELVKSLRHNSSAQSFIDELVSYAERRYAYNTVQKKSKRNGSWLSWLANYGHTISGNIPTKDKKEIDYSQNPILRKLSDLSGIPLTLKTSNSDRNVPNSRWFVRYVEGVFDGDAHAPIVYGDLFIPLEVVNMPSNQTTSQTAEFKKIKFEKEWFINVGDDIVRNAISNFSNCFWLPKNNHCVMNITSSGETTRTITAVTPYGQTLTLLETLKPSSLNKNGCEYSGTGFPGIKNYVGRFIYNPTDKKLKWEYEFSAHVMQDILTVLIMNDDASVAMNAYFQKLIAPQFSTHSHK
jgi:hypothetical protein